MKMYLDALLAEIKFKPQQFFVGLCVFFVAIMGTSVQHVASAAFALLVLAGLFILKDWKTTWQTLTKYEKWLLIGFSLYAFSAVISYINVQDTREYIKILERYFRFLLAVPIYLFIKKYNINVINYLFAGAVVSGPLLFFIAFSDYLDDPDFPAKGYYHHIIFGSVAMLNVGVMLSILLAAKVYILIRIVIAISMSCGFVAAVLSQSRGVWLVLPLYMLIALYYTFRNSRAKFAALMIVFVLIGGVLLTTPVGDMAMKRVDTAVTEVTSFYANTGEKYWSSLGTRLAMWHIALDVWKQYPLVGSGPGDLNDVVRELQSNGVYPGMHVHSSTHNIYIQSLVDIGIIGFMVMMISIFVIPFLALVFNRSSGEVTYLAGMSTLMLFGVIGMSESWTLRLPIISVYIIYIMTIVSSKCLADTKKSDPA